IAGTGGGNVDMTPDRDFKKMLKADCASPDMTRRIMGQLGFMRGTPGAVARAKRRVRLQRAAWIATAMLSGFIGWELLQYSDLVRKPTAVTVSSALEHDLATQSSKLDATMSHVARLISFTSTQGAGAEKSTSTTSEVGSKDEAAVGGGTPPSDASSQHTEGDAERSAQGASDAVSPEVGGTRASGGSAAPLWMTPSDSSELF
ncbi:MAG TPA: hypothetical protein VG711_07425, partial [Phycisphaerales bacterium]|nr:hypothetical protein [Phycisphaerales bacterium]